MSRLIIVAGAGGSGKSFFLKHWRHYDPDVIRIKKFVDKNRAPRKYEIKTGDSDLIFADCFNPDFEEGRMFYQNAGLTCHKDLQFHNNVLKPNDKYAYSYRGVRYKIDFEKIDEALSNEKTAIVVVRKAKTILNLLNIYHDAIIIYLYTINNEYSSTDESHELTKAERESRIKEDLKDYIDNISLLPSGIPVILNDYVDDSVQKQIEELFNAQIRDHHFRHKSIFVIQSYADPTSEGNFNMIKRAAKECFGPQYDSDSLVKRADSKNGTYMIPTHVWDSIDNSDCIVCDITNDRCDNCKEMSDTDEKKTLQGISSNVWIELGYVIKTLKGRKTHEVGKRLIIVSREDKHTKKSLIPVNSGGTALKVETYLDQNSLLECVKKSLEEMFPRNI